MNMNKDKSGFLQDLASNSSKGNKVNQDVEGMRFYVHFN